MKGLTKSERIIEKLANYLSDVEGEDKLLDESLKDAGLNPDEIEIVHDIAHGIGQACDNERTINVNVNFPGVGDLGAQIGKLMAELDGAYDTGDGDDGDDDAT